MRSAASNSWTLRFDVLKEPHVALFVRDALGLDHGAVRQPPRLEAPLPDLRGLVGALERERLADFYRSYWQESSLASAWEQEPVSDARQDLAASHREIDDRLNHFYGPLADHRDLWDEASVWFEEHRERHEPLQRDHETAMGRWKTSRGAANAAAAELGVEPGELSAGTWLVMVEGLWWAAPSPGRLLYSPSVREDLGLLANLLRATFTASLKR